MNNLRKAKTATLEMSIVTRAESSTLTRSIDDVLRITKDWPLFPQDDRGLYHIVVSLIISQRIRFSVGQAIRSRIYQTLAEASLNGVAQLTEEQRVACGINKQKWRIIQNFDAAWRTGDHHAALHSTGISSWTRQCALIMSGDLSTGFITSDLAVRKELGRLLCLERTPSAAMCARLTDSLSPHQGAELFSKLWQRSRTPQAKHD